MSVLNHPPGSSTPHPSAAQGMTREQIMKLPPSTVLALENRIASELRSLHEGWAVPVGTTTDEWCHAQARVALDTLANALNIPSTVPPEPQGIWLHCSPELMATGMSCAVTPRRACECAFTGSHDHLVDLRIALMAVGNKTRTAAGKANYSDDSHTREYWRGYRSAAYETADSLYELAAQVVTQ